jgi:hypothetical protein
VNYHLIDLKAPHIFKEIKMKQKKDNDATETAISGRKIPSSEYIRLFNIKYKNISSSISYMNTDTKKAIFLLNGLLKEELKNPYSEHKIRILISFALSYDIAGDMKSSYAKWREVAILPARTNPSIFITDAFLWAKCAIVCVEVGQYGDADFAYKKAVYWLRNDPPNDFSPKDIKDVNLENVRVAKDNIRAVSYLALAISEFGYTGSRGKNPYTGSVRADNKADEYIAKSLQFGRGKVKVAAKLQADKMQAWKAMVAKRQEMQRKQGK